MHRRTRHTEKRLGNSPSGGLLQAIGLPLAFILLCASTEVGAQDSAPWLEGYKAAAARIIGESFSGTFAWNRLAELTDSFGSRLSGSPSLAQAADWALARMKTDGLESVRKEKVMVSRWIRGNESAEIVRPWPSPLVMLGLGGSAATPPEGIEAEVLVVSSFADLEAKGEAARGKIVLYNVPFTNYGETVQYRTQGASRAARYGAVAALVRSVGPPGLRTPHTGVMLYSGDGPKVPAAAVTVEDAERLQRMQDRGIRVVVRLKMESHFEPEAESCNVVGEIRGREKEEEIVLIGGHLDSWDVGAGATDDAVGCIVTWEAARLLKKLDLRPRRTVRVVLFTNEENGGRGGIGYRDQHADEASLHTLALEADSGVFPPLRLGFTGTESDRRRLDEITTLLKGIGMDGLEGGGGGADIGPMVQLGKVPAMALSGDPQRYFTVHHTPADTVDKIDPEEVSRAAAAIAVTVYVAAEMPERLGRPTTP